MLASDYQYKYDFSCSAAEHFTGSGMKVIEGSFDSFYQLTDKEVKHEILNYVPVGYVSVSDFDWKETKIDNGMLR